MRALAVDVGGSHVSCAAVENERLLEVVRIETGSDGRLAKLLPLLERELCALASRHDSGFDGLAFGFCGLVDGARGRVVSTNHKYTDATGIDLPSWALERMGYRLILENDARLALLGEWYCGAARGAEDVVMMTLGTGIGTAAIMAGRLLRGRHFQAGSLGGHFTIELEGQLCSCGARGCFEAESSTYSLPGLSRAWPGFEASVLASIPKLDFASLFACADRGDEVALQIRDRCIKIWSACAFSIVHAYDPELLILGGGVMNASYPILPTIQQHLNSYAWTPWGKVQAVRAQLGEQAALLGAVPLLEGR